MNKLELVEGRECGECGLCCNILAIESPGLVSLPGVDCEQLRKEGGCKIHQTRPEMCKAWFCLWRFMPQLDDDWRPDRKGILITDINEDIPEEYSEKGGLKFVITGDNADIFDQSFIDYLGAFIDKGFPCFLSVTMPKRTSTKTFLNDDLLPAVQDRNLAEFKRHLSFALEECLSESTNEMEIIDGKIVTHAQEEDEEEKDEGALH